jgi:hypothetical protein
MSPVLAHAGGVPEFVSTALISGALVSGWAGASRLRGRGFPRLPKAAGWTLVAIAPIVLAASIVVPSKLWPPPSAIRPRSTASLAFANPAPEQRVTGDTLDVVLHLSGGRIVQASSTNLTPDTGHIHVYLDDVLVSMTYGIEQQVPIGDLVDGRHRLEAEFVAADHAPFEPRVIATVVFVKEGS